MQFQLKKKVSKLILQNVVTSLMLALPEDTNLNKKIGKIWCLADSYFGQAHVMQFLRFSVHICISKAEDYKNYKKK